MFSVLYTSIIRGGVSCIIILGNFSTHILMNKDGFCGADRILDNIIVLFLLPNVICRYQLLQMGIIS